MTSLHSKLTELAASSQDFVMGVTGASSQVCIQLFFVTEHIILVWGRKRKVGILTEHSDYHSSVVNIPCYQLNKLKNAGAAKF